MHVSAPLVRGSKCNAAPGFLVDYCTPEKIDDGRSCCDCRGEYLLVLVSVEGVVPARLSKRNLSAVSDAAVVAVDKS